MSASVPDRAVAANAVEPVPVSPVPASIPSAVRSPSDLAARPKPRTVAELETLSTWYFGAPLHLSMLQVYGETAQYRVAELYNSYHGRGWLHAQHCCRGYDYSEAFWQHVVGKLYCGGIAARSYGQTRHSPDDSERLAALAADVASAMSARSDETGTGSVRQDASAAPQEGAQTQSLTPTETGEQGK